MTRTYGTAVERLAARTVESGECLIWTGGTGSGGYGRLRHNGQPESAHRVAWEHEHGPIPDGAFVDHICHNRACVKVAHLRLATQGENNQNKKGASRGSASGIRNVYPEGGKWKVLLGLRGEKHYFGMFEDIEEASSVAVAARQKLFGEFAGGGGPNA